MAYMVMAHLVMADVRTVDRQAARRHLVVFPQAALRRYQGPAAASGRIACVRALHDQDRVRRSTHAPLHMPLHVPLHMPLHISSHMSLHTSMYVPMHISVHMSLHMFMHMLTHMATIRASAGPTTLVVPYKSSKRNPGQGHRSILSTRQK